MAGYSHGLGDLERGFVREADSTLSSYGYFFLLRARNFSGTDYRCRSAYACGGGPRLEDMESTV